MATVADSRLMAPPGSAFASARENLLLADLAEEDLTRIVDVSEFKNFDGDAHLALQGEALARVHFPVSGYASLLVADESEAQMQIALVGREGVLGWESLLGQEHFLFDVYVPQTLRTLSVEVGAFRVLTAGARHLATVQLEYLASLFGVAARSVLCARFHPLEARLARCLLEVYDRHPTGPILLTQSTLSKLLGVRRSGVTNAATHLQLLGLINYRRGEIRILKRHGLESAACDCYRRQAHER